MIADLVTGVWMLVCGLLELFFTYRAIKHIKKAANAETSPFILFALWSAFSIGLMLAVVGTVCLVTTFA